MLYITQFVKSSINEENLVLVGSNGIEFWDEAGTRGTVHVNLIHTHKAAREKTEKLALDCVCFMFEHFAASNF